MAASGVRRRAGVAEEPRAATLIETDADGNSQVYLFTVPPPSDFYCPLSRSILVDPVVTPYGHTFSKVAILQHLLHTGKCPITQKPLREAQLRPNLLARTMVEELEVRCPYGVKLGEDGWQEDEDGCPDTYKLGLRRAKLKACKYRPVKCPYGGRKCGLIPRLDLSYHLSEECQHLHKRNSGQDEESGIDTLEVLTVLLVWGLLLFAFYQTHFFGRLMREASGFLTLLLGIPVTLAFVAILAEYFINSRADKRSRGADDDE